MVALWVNPAARSCCLAPEMRPVRPPKSKSRYESVTLGFSTDCWTAVRPWLATVLMRAAVTSPSMVGSQAPRWEP